jgi:hypothetical protein
VVKVLKFWIAFILAASASAIIFAAGMMNNTRMGVIIYRMAVAAVCLGALGALIGVLYEKRLLPYLMKKEAEDLGEADSEQAEEQKKEEPKTAENGENGENGAGSNEEETEKASGFAPFTTDNFKRVSPPN